ncbi:MAG: hypothetical protein ACD_78C00448G0001 [uncultured bacterium (gcode 4)]|uniref:Uncharacterized protein n=1 Tax=uncultured bacterium (gcode 4) TaxID=1234023 RepID=K1XGC6_9BACT|nr:MAG: hypothetical protein ACD_78C00448G0001 [uncultured bacterium (gcode 4)]
MYLNGIPTTITNHSSLLGGTTVSKTINNVGVGGVIRFKTSETPEVRDGSGNIIVPWTITYREDNFPPSTILFQWSELQAFEGNTNNISGSYEDTVTVNPTYRSQGFYASLQYLESPFDIRISLPIIANIAGGSAFIGSALGNSVDIVVQTFFNNLRSGNFTTSTVNVASSYALSSATNSVSNDGVLSQVISSGSTAEIGNITQSSLNTSGIYTVTSLVSELEIDSKSIPLSDAVNIRVFKDGDVSIDGNLDLTGVKTVIVENGNLIINSDIRYNDSVSSFAWIIKNGNIIVADTVQEIAGVYVTLAGSITSNNMSTPNRLIVDGSLYGNTSDLVNNRSYVRGQVGYTALNVGVVVNYSNRSIMYPPPFLARFLEQYSLQRVAR